ncbi:MAG: Type pilus biosis and competence protein pilQ precursor [Pseudomonadota bacterium]|jgi:pilus assembly protein CpaC
MKTSVIHGLTSGRLSPAPRLAKFCRWRWLTFLLLALGAVLSANATEAVDLSAGSNPPQSVAAQSSAQPAPLQLQVGQAHVLRTGEVRRIVIGNGKVIQATALDERQVLVIPESIGRSTLHLWGKDGSEQSLVVDVIGADAGRVLSEVRAMLGPADNLSARLVGDKVVIDGNALREEQAARIAEVLRRYPQVISLVSRIGFERMIAIDVRMVEIRRDRLESIGVRWNGSMNGPSFGVIGDLHRSDALRPGGNATGVAPMDVRPRIEPFATSLGIASSIGSMINLMVQNGEAVVLAEPSLSCRSGGSARFIAGGELPIPQTSGLGNATVAFKEYGVKFDVSPVASESGVIAARIATEISSINFDVLVKDVPGLTKRRAETEVNLREHETLVIAGLLTDESSRTVDRVPALGELPVLGGLFRSSAFRDRKTELVVFVTPRYAEPDRPGAIPAVRRSADETRAALEQTRDRIRMAE